MKHKILNTLTDAVSNIVYYDRKEDEDLEIGDIESALVAGVISIDEMSEHFKKELTKAVRANTSGLPS